MLTAVLCLALAQDPTDDQIRKWIGQLGAEYLEEREEARKKLAEVGRKAEDPLVEALESAEFRVRRGALELLLGMKSTKAVKTVSEMFRNPEEDRSVRQSAFAYLRGAGKAAEDVLIEALESEEREYRLGAVQTLKEIKSEKCAEKVADLYDREPEKDVKDAAFDCLKNIGKPAQPYLLKLLGSADAGVRTGALDGLRNVNREKKDPEVIDRVGAMFVVESDPNVASGAFLFLKESGDKALPHFGAGLRSALEAVRLKSLEGLATAKSDLGIAEASKLFESDSSDAIRVKAKDYLELFGRRSEDVFSKALDNRNARVKLLAVEALGKIESSKPLERISKMFREDRDPVVHRAAFDYLSRLGLKAEDDLLFALQDADRTIKLDAVAALGKAKSEKAIPSLIDLLSSLDQEFKAKATEALVRAGPKAVEAVRVAVQAKKVTPRDADAILARYHLESVEQILAKFMSEEGGYGFYEGMFEPLREYGVDLALPVLLRIVRDRGYRSGLAKAKGSRDDFDKHLRELAIMALGDLGDHATVEALESIQREMGQVLSEEETCEVVVSLYKLGAKKHLEDWTKSMERQAEAALAGKYPEDGFGKLFLIGLLQNRVGQREAAEKVYVRVVDLIERLRKGKEKEVPEYEAALYNLACLTALRGEKKAAAAYLRRAIVAGFKDRGWIQIDKDLESLRSEPEYQKLLGDDELFKKDKE